MLPIAASNCVFKCSIGHDKRIHGLPSWLLTSLILRLIVNLFEGFSKARQRMLHYTLPLDGIRQTIGFTLACVNRYIIIRCSKKDFHCFLSNHYVGVSS